MQSNRPRDNVQGLHLRLRRDSRRDVDDAVLHLDVILCKKDIQGVLGNRPLNGLTNAGDSQGCGVKERIEVITCEKQINAQRHFVTHRHRLIRRRYNQRSTSANQQHVQHKVMRILELGNRQENTRILKCGQRCSRHVNSFA
ncbi:hypothetical protein D3C85_1070660 [compost metagenome]